MNVGENSIIRNWESVAFKPRLLPPSPTLAPWDGDSSWDCCRQEHRAPSSLPPARGFSCWEGQDLSIFHPVPSSLLLKLSPQWLWWRGWGRLSPLLMEWCAKNTGSLVTHAPACEVDVPHQERQVEGTPGSFSTITHRMFSCYSRSVTEREACYCPSPQLQSPSSDFAWW